MVRIRGAPTAARASQQNRSIRATKTGRRQLSKTATSQSPLLGCRSARDGQVLEGVYVPAHTSDRVIHSMKLRPSTRATFL
ncbi:MAG TPA: hypothetical protein DEG13_00310 [Candidatus Microthrix parvicella]|nr:hypothetical protein [Candidatus Microthrix parvicella]